MPPPWGPVGGLVVLLVLLGARDTHCRDTSVDFVTQHKAECQFVNGTQRVRFLERYSYNRQQDVHFDSELGFYVADSPFGEPDARAWNSDAAILADARAQVQRYCIYNYGIFEDFMSRRRVPPTVTVSLTKSEDPENPHLLVCKAYGFYPYAITVRWLKNGKEDHDVVTTDLMQNGDWTGQIMVMLQMSAQRGDTFTCEVEHVSLKEPVRREWKLEASDSAKNKMTTGIVGFVLGGLFLAIGLIIYWRNQKACSQVTNRHPEGAGLMPTDNSGPLPSNNFPSA